MLKGSYHCGQVHWTFRATPDAATACNCTACRRYGVLWIYGHEGEAIVTEGTTTAYSHGSKSLSFHFCPTCGNLAWWRSNHTDEQGRRRMAVNIRLSNSDSVATIPLEHFDGLVTFEDLGQDGKCVRDVWF